MMNGHGIIRLDLLVAGRAFQSHGNCSLLLNYMHYGWGSSFS